MRRFFRKDPPPGWTPPPRVLVVPKVPPAGGVAFEEFQRGLQKASEAIRRAHPVPTASLTWSATAPTDSTPWSARPHERVKFGGEGDIS